MRIKIVDPHEKRARFALEPVDRQVGCFGGGALSSIADKGVIVVTETPRQTKLAGKRKTRNEGRRLIA